MITPQKLVLCNYSYEHKDVFLQASFRMLITLLFHVILNFQSTKLILAFNIFSIFNLIVFIYMKRCTKSSRRLRNYLNQHVFIMVFQLLSSLLSF